MSKSVSASERLPTVWGRFVLSLSVIGLLLCIYIVALVCLASGRLRSVGIIENAFGRVMYDFNRSSSSGFDVNAANPPVSWIKSGVGLHLFHSVVFVDLDSDRVTDRTMSALRALQDIEIVHISNTVVTNDGLAVLKYLPKLRVLTINTDGIGDVGLNNVAKVNSLEELELYDCGVKDRGLQHLENSRSLRRLLLDKTQVTRLGVEKLKHALPNCKIEAF
jgi:hypothetical protein